MKPTAAKLGYTIAEFTSAHGVGKTKVFAEIKAGRLRARKCGARTLILEDDARVWRESLPDLHPRN